MNAMGCRYNQETLSCYYKGKNINDVLEMRVEEAMHFFENRHANLPQNQDAL
jgi:excinuclease ABC subunit A